MQRSSRDMQEAFAAALFDSSVAPPAFIAASDSVDRADRFAIYRNNVIVGLTDALRSRFPVTARLVGEEFFAASARLFILDHLPENPVLIRWGDAYADFLATFEPAKSVPYLSDIARLEVAWNRAYHAAEAAPLDPEADFPPSPDRLASMRLIPHPSAQALTSRHPIASIWAAHQCDGEVRPPASWSAEDVLVVRPGAEVFVYPLPAGSAHFIGDVFGGAYIGAAAMDAVARFPQFDVARSVLGLFQVGAITGIQHNNAWELKT